jgi:hypothetical protein
MDGGHTVTRIDMPYARQPQSEFTRAGDSWFVHTGS